MIASLDDTKRSAIGMEIADIKVLQQVLIDSEQKLLPAVSSDKEISDRLNDFIKDDQQNPVIFSRIFFQKKMLIRR